MTRSLWEDGTFLADNDAPFWVSKVPFWYIVRCNMSHLSTFGVKHCK